MSSGSQNGTTLAGLQGMRIRDASDVITQTKLRIMYTTNTPSGSGYSGVNAYRSKGNQNSYNFLLQVQKGLRECGVFSNGTYNTVAGQPFALTSGTIVNPSGVSVTVPTIIPTL